MLTHEPAGTGAGNCGGSDPAVGGERYHQDDWRFVAGKGVCRLPRRRKGERILGPYGGSDGWRLVLVNEAGERACRLFSTEKAANKVLYDLVQKLRARERKTIGEAIEEYEMFQREEKGNKR